MTYPEQPWQGRRFAVACRIGRVLGLALLIAWLAGCQHLPWAEQAPPEPEPELETTEQQPEMRPPPSMQSIIDLLESGRWDEAESGLLRVLDARPGHRLALRFLEQLQSDPIELMGEDFDLVTVRSGESLSVIAARELGDGMQFLALARYNAITVPRRLAPGRNLRIPKALREMPSPPEPIDEPPPVAVTSPGEGLALTGQQLVEDGRYQQAIALLSAAGRAGNLDEQGQMVLAQAGVARAQSLMDEGELESGLGLLDRLAEMLDDSALGYLEPERNRLSSRLRYADAVAARRAGRLDEALEIFEQAVELDAEFSPAREEADQLRGVLVIQLHEQALVHYRDQQLSESIELWERVLRLDQTFEPAQVYLARAKALKSRLDDLDS
jgi:tetratricopeptide (TPR) repeat protein